jgi:8-oxo-dGTP pyrophosphatase MutT (NUDIX family)
MRGAAPPDRQVANAVLTCRGRVALQRRDGRTPVYPHYWGLFGGTVEEGEAPSQSMVREVREELGISLAEVRPLGVCLERPCRLNEWKAITVHVFAAEIAGLWSKRRLSEGVGCALFDWPSVRRMKSLVTPMAFKILENHFGAGSPRLYAPPRRAR